MVELSIYNRPNLRKYYETDKVVDASEGDENEVYPRSIASTHLSGFSFQATVQI